jgi:hypothetical protein
LKNLVFVSVVVLVIAVFFPSFFSFSKDQGLDEATNLLCNQILLTRQKAIAGNTRYRIHYDFTNGDCRILREEAPGRWVPDIPDKRRCFPEGIFITPTGTHANGYIEIAANGAVENHGVPLVLELTDPDGKQRSIRISPSGMVQELPSL